MYPAKPLLGVWATAPYLHNGSVPTLWDLLSPVDQRPATFNVGQREYDPVKVGYVQENPPNPKYAILDTSLDGNHRTGHEFGTALTPAEKYDLIAFLKTLTVTKQEEIHKDVTPEK